MRRDFSLLPLTLTRLREVATYAPDTGYFMPAGPARGMVSRNKPLGGKAGADGYRNIAIDRVSYPASYLAWLWHYGNWPQGTVDHINGNRDDNRISNLREVSLRQNRANRKAPALYVHTRNLSRRNARPSHCPCGAPIVQPERLCAKRTYCAECIKARERVRALAYYHKGVPKEDRRPNPRVVGGGRKKMPALTQDFLHTILRYDPDTGIANWLQSHGRAQAGMVAGTKHRDPAKGFTGYIAIGIGRKRYLMHRLIWFYVHGVWPRHQIDHINGDKADNRLVNLREATISQNSHNVDLGSRNTSGYKGVSFYRDRRWPDRTGWRAQLMVGGKRHYLGTFDTAEAAAAAYRIASESHVGAFSRADELAHADPHARRKNYRIPKSKITAALALVKAGTTYREAAEALGLPKSSLYNHIARAGLTIPTLREGLL